MAEENDKQTEAAPKGGVLRLAIIGVVSLAIGAGGTFFVLRQPEGETTPADEAAASGEEGEAAPEAPFEERVLALEPFVVNLGGNGPPRYLKAQISLELGSPEDLAQLSGQVPRIRDTIIVLLSSRRLADMQEFAGKVLIKEDILDRVNGALDEPAVQEVMFTEFVVQ